MEPNELKIRSLRFASFGMRPKGFHPLVSAVAHVIPTTAGRVSAVAHVIPTTVGRRNLAFEISHPYGVRNDVRTGRGCRNDVRTGRGGRNAPRYIMKQASYLRGAAILTLGGLAAKVIGALYRIPLANALGGYGMGLYQMAYPLFCVLLTFTSTGIPSALSRVVAAERARGTENGGTVRSALRLFGVLGAAGTAAMLLFAWRACRGTRGLFPVM